MIWSLLHRFAIIHIHKIKWGGGEGMAWSRTGLSHSMILYYLLSSPFSRSFPPTQPEYFLPVLGEPPMKRERATNNIKSWNGTGLEILTMPYLGLRRKSVQKFQKLVVCTELSIFTQGSSVMRVTECLFKRRYVLAWKCCYIFLHLSSPNLIENDHNLVFFGYKVSTQQHFKTRLFWKTTKKLRIHALLEMPVWVPKARSNEVAESLEIDVKLRLYTVRQIKLNNATKVVFLKVSCSRTM